MFAHTVCVAKYRKSDQTSPSSNHSEMYLTKKEGTIWLYGFINLVKMMHMHILAFGCNSFSCESNYNFMHVATAVMLVL